MSDERIMILKMLEEGKIGADEAAKLLGSIKDESEEPKVEQSTQQSNTNQTNNNSNNSSSGGNSGGSSINFDELGRTLGSISKDMAKKFGIFAKDMAPKLQTMTEVLVEKTASVTDKISKSVATPPRPAPAPRPTPPPASTPPRPASRPAPPKPVNAVKGRTKEKSCEIVVTSSYANELYITSKNGMVYIKGYNGDKITAKLNYMSNTDNIELTQSGDRYYLDYDDSEFSSVSIEAFVPEKLFKRMHIIANSSKVSVDGMGSEEIIIETVMAEINLKNLGSNYIKAVTDKADVFLDNIVSGSLEIITANGKIDATSLDVQKLKLETDNCPISYKAFTLKSYTNYNWRISTSNASMRINLPISEDIGYDIKANTSLNNVSAGISGLQYVYNESNYIEAKTSNFSKAYRKIKVEMDTSNAPISIN